MLWPRGRSVAELEAAAALLGEELLVPRPASKSLAKPSKQHLLSREFSCGQHLHKEPLNWESALLHVAVESTQLLSFQN